MQALVAAIVAAPALPAIADDVIYPPKGHAARVYRTAARAGSVADSNQGDFEPDPKRNWGALNQAAPAEHQVQTAAATPARQSGPKHRARGAHPAGIASRHAAPAKPAPNTASAN